MTNTVSAGLSVSTIWEWILKVPDYSGRLIWIAGALLVAPFVLRQFRVSVALMYHMKFRRDRSELGRVARILYIVFRPLGWTGAFGKVVQVALSNLGAIVLKKYSVADLTRIWIEYDIFDKRIAVNWAAQANKSEGLKRELAINVPHPGIVMNEVRVIDRYCAKVDALGITAKQEQPGFFCPIKIESGFVAAFHLLSGLLGQFGETWPAILKGFEKEAQLDDVLKEHGVAENFQQIQSYIYYCWLLWGPSIPVCSENCKRWDKDYLWLQYGFGDENNSIDIVGARGFLRRELENCLPKPGKGGSDKGVMAVPASVLGRLRYDNVKTFETGQIAPAPKDRLSSKTVERRSLLFVDEIRSDAKDSDRSLYYSGYLWVMFVILAEETTRSGRKVWLPLHPDDSRLAIGGGNPLRSAMPWKDSIPFFEHGNFADPETCAFGKSQLVEKALNGLAALVKDNGGDKFPLRFAYASAIDDPNCNWSHDAPEGERLTSRRDQLAFPELAGGELIVDLLERRLAKEAANAESAVGGLARANPPLIDFARFTGVSGDHPHSACFLPEHVGRHFDALAELAGDQA